MIMSEYPDHPNNICPECQQKCISAFRCIYATRYCSNGHAWHIMKDTIIPGVPPGQEDLQLTIDRIITNQNQSK